MYSLNPFTRFLALVVTVSTVIAPLVSAQPSPVTVGINGQYFINNGLVGVGRIPAAAKDKFGTVDVLVNNAAVLHMGGIERTTAAEFRRVFDVNALGAFLGIKAVSAVMRANGGVTMPW